MQLGPVGCPSSHWGTVKMPAPVVATNVFFLACPLQIGVQVPASRTVVGVAKYEDATDMSKAVAAPTLQEPLTLVYVAGQLVRGLYIEGNCL